MVVRVKYESEWNSIIILLLKENQNLSTQLIKPNYLVILPPTQHHSFFRNLPPLFVFRGSIVKTKHQGLTSLTFMELVPGDDRVVRHICIRCMYLTAENTVSKIL